MSICRAFRFQLIPPTGARVAHGAPPSGLQSSRTPLNRVKYRFIGNRQTLNIFKIGGCPLYLLYFLRPTRKQDDLGTLDRRDKASKLPLPSNLIPF